MDKRAYSWEFSVLALAGVAALFVLLVTLMNGQIREAENRVSDLQSELTEVERNTLDLDYDIQVLGSDGYAESKARSSRNYAKQGAIRFVIGNPELLSNYTAEELQVILDERSQPER